MNLNHGSMHLDVHKNRPIEESHFWVKIQRLSYSNEDQIYSETYKKFIILYLTTHFEFFKQQLPLINGLTKQTQGLQGNRLFFMKIQVFIKVIFIYCYTASSATINSHIRTNLKYKFGRINAWSMKQTYKIVHFGRPWQISIAFLFTFW